MQDEDAEHCAPVAAGELGGLATHLGFTRDRQKRAHAAVTEVTGFSLSPGLKTSLTPIRLA